MTVLQLNVSIYFLCFVYHNNKKDTNWSPRCVLVLCTMERNVCVYLVFMKVSSIYLSCSYVISSSLTLSKLTLALSKKECRNSIEYFHFTTGCCKTSVKLCKPFCDTFLGVILLFLCSFDCQIWAIFHFGTLWLWKLTYFLKI